MKELLANKLSSILNKKKLLHVQTSSCSIRIYFDNNLIYPEVQAVRILDK